MEVDTCAEESTHICTAAISQCICCTKRRIHRTQRSRGTEGTQGSRGQTEVKDVGAGDMGSGGGARRSGTGCGRVQGAGVLRGLQGPPNTGTERRDQTLELKGGTKGQWCFGGPCAPLDLHLKLGPEEGQNRGLRVWERSRREGVWGPL